MINDGSVIPIGNPVTVDGYLYQGYWSRYLYEHHDKHIPDTILRRTLINACSEAETFYITTGDDAYVWEKIIYNLSDTVLREKDNICIADGVYMTVLQCPWYYTYFIGGEYEVKSMTGIRVCPSYTASIFQAIEDIKRFEHSKTPGYLVTSEYLDKKVEDGSLVEITRYSEDGRIFAVFYDEKKRRAYEECLRCYVQIGTSSVWMLYQEPKVFEILNTLERKISQSTLIENPDGSVISVILDEYGYSWDFYGSKPSYENDVSDKRGYTYHPGLTLAEAVKMAGEEIFFW